MVFYWVLPGFISFYRIWLCFTRFYWVLSGVTGFYWVVLGFTGFWLDCWHGPSLIRRRVRMLGLRRLAADRWRHIPTPVRPHGRFHSLDRAQWRNDFDWFSFPFGRRRRRPNKRSRSLAHFVRWRHRNGQRGENFSLFFFFIFFFIFFLRFLLLKIFRFGARPPRTAKVRMSADLLRGLWLVDATPERKPWPKLFRTTRKKKRMFQADPVHNSIFFRTSATRSNEWTSSRPSFRSDDALLSSIDFRCEVSFLLSTYNWNVIDRPIEWSRVVVVDVFFFFF